MRCCITKLFWNCYKCVAALFNFDRALISRSMHCAGELYLSYSSVPWFGIWRAAWSTSFGTIRKGEDNREEAQAQLSKWSYHEEHEQSRHIDYVAYWRKYVQLPCMVWRPSMHNVLVLYFSFAFLTSYFCIVLMTIWLKWDFKETKGSSLRSDMRALHKLYTQIKKIHQRPRRNQISNTMRIQRKVFLQSFAVCPKIMSHLSNW